jgi:hypothetical protein
MKKDELIMLSYRSSYNHYLLSLSKYDMILKIFSHLFRVSNLSGKDWDFRKRFYSSKFFVLPFDALRLSKVYSDDS